MISKLYSLTVLTLFALALVLILNLFNDLLTTVLLLLMGG